MPKTSKAPKTRLAAAAALAALAVVAPLTLAGTAHAAGGTAPACVQRDVSRAPGGGGGGVVYLENNCGRTMKVQVVFMSGRTSSCYTMTNGRALVVPYNSPLVYARTAVC
ncbi:hypothetical protein [Streptomyces sp. NPDC090022]|uniref:hypothetical protein n=1 Tax=Streptomyces sp. NPDC090022 TaxID=3365920 RepID=UPI00382E87FC